MSNNNLSDTFFDLYPNPLLLSIAFVWKYILSKWCPIIDKNNKISWFSVLFTICCGILFIILSLFSKSKSVAKDIILLYHCVTFAFVLSRLSLPKYGQDIDDDLYKNISNPSKPCIIFSFFIVFLSTSWMDDIDDVYDDGNPIDALKLATSVDELNIKLS